MADLLYTSVFSRNRELLSDKSKRFILNQGGSRSSKTYSLCQLMIVAALSEAGLIISIVRKTFPALRATVMRDFFKIMNDLGIYDRNRHNKTEHIYTFPNGSLVEFFSVDEEQKVRGRKRDILWANEANQLWEDDFVQLNLRTERVMFFDFNPSDLSGYLYDLEARPNAALIKSTYRDNPFLSEAQIEELEFLQYTDPDAYRIYNLGERAQTREHVLTHWRIDSKPPELDQHAYGLDFGWNHPTSLIRVWHDGSGKRFHLQQVVQQSELTNESLINILNEEVDKSIAILADAARPEFIAAIQEAGFSCWGADKAVKKGLDVLKSSIITVDPESRELIRNLENYRYQKIKGKLTDEVIKLDDDGPDAARYATTYLRSVSGGMQFTAMRW